MRLRVALCTGTTVVFFVRSCVFLVETRIETPCENLRLLTYPLFAVEPSVIVIVSVASWQFSLGGASAAERAGTRALRQHGWAVRGDQHARVARKGLYPRLRRRKRVSKQPYALFLEFQIRFVFIPQQQVDSTWRARQHVLWVNRSTHQLSQWGIN